MIILELRDGNIVLSEEEFKHSFDFEWFIGKLVTLDFNITNPDYENKFILWESKDAVLSILDSIRYNKLIVHNNCNLDYLEALIDKWCLPEWMRSDISKLNKEQNTKSFDSNNKQTITLKTLGRNFILRCVNCHSGFNYFDNKETSCKSHKSMFSNNHFACCGLNPDHPNDYTKKFIDGCIQGYHVASVYDIEQITKIFKLNENENESEV